MRLLKKIIWKMLTIKTIKSSWRQLFNSLILKILDANHTQKEKTYFLKFVLFL